VRGQEVIAADASLKELMQHYASRSRPSHSDAGTTPRSLRSTGGSLIRERICRDAALSSEGSTLLGIVLRGSVSSATDWRSRRIRSLGSGCNDSRRGSLMRTIPGNARWAPRLVSQPLRCSENFSGCLPAFDRLMAEVAPPPFPQLGHGYTVKKINALA
jgi:hypothetical protein